jgi:four helix bundle protein
LIADLTIPREVEMRGNCDLGGCVSSECPVFVGFSFGPEDAMRGGMNPRTVELQARTRRFAASVIAFCEQLSHNVACQRIVPQLIDSANATDSNYRAACRGRSKAEFIAKLGVACEEADESKGWLELLVESKQARGETVDALIQEADELVSIFAKSRITAETNKKEQDRRDGQRPRDRGR